MTKEEEIGLRIRDALEQDVREMMEIFNYEVRNTTASFAIQEKTYEDRLEWFHAHGTENHPLIVAEEDGRATPACPNTVPTRLTEKPWSCLSTYRRNSGKGEWARL